MPRPDRVFVVNVRSRDAILKPTPDLVIREGDVIAVIGRQEIHATRGNTIRPEVSDPKLLDIPVDSLDVVVTNRSIAGKRLADLARLQSSRGVFLSRLTRSGIEIPISSVSIVDRGDVMRLIGPLPEVEKAAAVLGYPDRPTSATDMIFVGAGIFLGGLVGLLSVVVWNVPLTLTASGGALVMGLVFGWLRSVYPFFGRIPEPAIWIFDTVGLCVFIGVVGLTVGPSFVAGLQTTGLSLVFVVLGAYAGAGTITAALRAVQDEAQSSIPALGYTVPYAIGNILLTAWGPVIVAMISI